MTSPTVSATTYYYGAMPLSAENATYYLVYPRYTTPEYAMYPIQIYNDSLTQDIYSSASATIMKSNDFKGNESGFPDYVTVPDNDTATIISVWLWLQCDLWVPGGYFKFSIDDGDTWNTSSFYSESGGEFHYWNVTNELTWNATIINSNETWVSYWAYNSYGQHYYIDYLGLAVTWTCDYVIEDSGASENPPDDPEDWGGWAGGWDFLYQDGGILAVMGLVGFIGVFATPLIGIAYYRNNPGEGKLRVGITCLVLFLIFLSFVMMSVTPAEALAQLIPSYPQIMPLG